MGQIILTAIFLVVWLPSILFTMSNSSIAPPLQETAVLKGPYQWNYKDRDFFIVEKQTMFLVSGDIHTISGPLPVIAHAGFIEWLYASSNRFNSDIRIFYTGLNERPYVTEAVLENDKGLTYSIGELRFNWVFVFSLIFCVILPVLYMLMLMADSVVIDSPEQRKYKSKKFIELVKSIEKDAEEDRYRLKRKTLSLAFLGYFVVLSSIVLMIPVGIGLFGSIALLSNGHYAGLKIAFILALIPIGFAWNMAKSLLSTGCSYEGVEIKHGDCPDLFEFLVNICKKTKGPKFSRVFIDQNYNASVSRGGGMLGFFGMGPVVLTLGLPLMQSMTERQLMGVIGHEYGHVAAKDNAWGQWIYRIRNSWLLLGERLGFDGLWYALKLNRFYEWFIATFSAYSFALSRRCEYEADAFSARLVGKESMAEALSSLVVFGNQYDDSFWNEIWARSDAGDAINLVQPYSNIPKFFSSLEQDLEAVSNAMKQKTGYTSTHPSIADRLSALSAEFKLEKATSITASSHMLGKIESKLVQSFNIEWQEAVKENWLQRQEEYTELQKKYNELRQKELQELNDDDIWSLVSVANSLDDNQLYYDASKEVLRRYPENIDARLNCIWFKLHVNKDSSQLSVMEELVKKHPEYLPDVCRYAIEFLTLSNREDETVSYYERLEDWEYIRSAAEDERAIILASDEYKAHGLSADAIADFVSYYSQHPLISKVYMAQKQVKYMPEYPSYLVAYVAKHHFWKTQKSVDEGVNDFIYNSGLSSEFSFVSLDSIKGLKNKISKIHGTYVYKKS